MRVKKSFSAYYVGGYYGNAYFCEGKKSLSADKQVQVGGRIFNNNNVESQN